jgi:hypothetical protein
MRACVCARSCAYVDSFIQARTIIRFATVSCCVLIACFGVKLKMVPRVHPSVVVTTFHQNRAEVFLLIIVDVFVLLSANCAEVLKVILRSGTGVYVSVCVCVS